MGLASKLLRIVVGPVTPPENQKENMKVKIARLVETGPLALSDCDTSAEVVARQAELDWWEQFQRESSDGPAATCPVCGDRPAGKCPACRHG